MSGYVWPLTTVHAVLGAYVTCLVDEANIHLNPSAAEEVTAMLFERLGHGLEPWAVQIARDDLDVAYSSRNAAFQIQFSARWKPQGRPVRLLGGGELDGTEITLKDDLIYGPGRVLVPRANPPAWFSANPEMFPTQPLNVATFNLGGWSEGDRVWIFQAA